MQLKHTKNIFVQSVSFNKQETLHLYFFIHKYILDKLF